MDIASLLIVNTFLLSFFILVFTLLFLLSLKKTRKEQRETIRSLKKQISED